MKFIGNLIWFVFVGIWSALVWFFSGIIWSITIIGIPFGRQCFKMGSLVIWPIGRKVKTNFDKHPIANVIWLIFGGLELATCYVLVGLLLSCTIIGIPYGRQCFKLAALSCIPFGATV